MNKISSVMEIPIISNNDITVYSYKYNCNEKYGVTVHNALLWLRGGDT